ncbi:MAG: TolB-like 6-bladed beta-propeller domain-containing protein [Bacteroidales bacterium]|nr:TolB-like 6-bladed beta-propeller domain-containing protein [Bacteroidales bacterium]
MKYPIILFSFSIFSSAILFTGCTSSHSDSKISLERNLVLAPMIKPELDSMQLSFGFYPERWTLTQGDTIWVVNSRDSSFLVGFDMGEQHDFCHWGTLGQGPEEYISPGIVEGTNENGFVLYGNTENRVLSYLYQDEEVTPIRRGQMPPWITDQGLPKPYTRISAINDSIYIGTYFLPREAGADIFNWHTGELIEELPLSLEQPEENMSGPYEFKIASNGNKIVVAYRYVNRVEVFNLSDNYQAELECVLGDEITQNDLYEADRDAEMIKYYTDVQCDSSSIYLLYHGVAEKDLFHSPTSLRVYDIDLTENQQNAMFDRFFDQFLLTTSGDVVLYSPNNEDYLFIWKTLSR